MIMFHVNLQGCFILPSAPAPPVHHSGVSVGSGIPHLPGRFVWLATFGEPCVALKKERTSAQMDHTSFSILRVGGGLY